MQGTILYSDAIKYSASVLKYKYKVLRIKSTLSTSTSTLKFKVHKCSEAPVQVPKYMSFRLVTTRHVNQHGGFAKAPFTFDIQVKSTNFRIIGSQCNNLQSTLGQTTSFQSICYRGTPQPRRHCVRQGPQLPSPNFSAHVRCGQTAGWTKMLLGMEVGLGPGDFVLDGDPAAPP